MTLMYLGVNQHQGLTLPNGKIAKMNRTQATVEDSTYTGNRLSNIDDADAGWDDNCAPGWFFVGGAVQKTYSVGLAGMIQKAIELHQQLLQWDEDVAFHGPGHPDWQRSFAHDALSSAHGHVYKVLNNTSISIANRTTYCETMLGGSSDGQGGRINSAIGYYSVFTVYGLFHTNRNAGSHYGWVDPTNPGTPLTLGALNEQIGTIPTGTVLGRGATWHELITA